MGSGEQGIGLEVRQDEGVYPVFLSLYQGNPAADLVIRNNESAEIRNVRVSFRAGNYTASEFPCGTVPLIGKGRGTKGSFVELPLYAEFSPDVLNFTEDGRIVGEVVIRYTLLGKEKEAVRAAAVRVYNRNTFAAGDLAALAAFVSPTSPEILEFSKYITGVARTQRRPGLNQNLQFGMWLFEGLRAYGIDIEDGSALSSVQFPAQTLAYKSGTSVDAGLLYAAALEAVGISTAIIPINGDFITAFSLGISKAAAASLFNGLDNILIVNDEVWLPVSMNVFNSGFSAAWEEAARKLNGLFKAGEDAAFIILEDCWSLYPPSPFPALGVRIAQPETAAFGSRAVATVNRYIAQEIDPLVREAQRAAQSSGTAAHYNRLGIVQLRAGRTAEAKASFERAAGMGSVSAMINRGNLALNEKDYSTTERWFRQALAAQPGNTAAIRGLEQVKERN
jgi:hypothetical protein